jgi:CRISPR/Cas system CSM-associated protein Csm3 (group 7 of RAMP superfamily)
MTLTYVQVDLRTQSPVMVTSPEVADFAMSGGEPHDHPKTDLPIRRGLDGRPVIPATTIAGSIRAALPVDVREELMGHAGQQAVPSRVNVLGCEVRVPESGSDVTEYHRTAIDRKRGAAASGKLFDGEALAAGAALIIRLVVDGQDLLPELLHALTGWQPHLGRGVTAGAGRTELLAVRTATLDLTRDEDLLLYLNGGGPDLVDQLIEDRGATETLNVTEREPIVDLEFEVVDAIHVGSPLGPQGNKRPVWKDAQGTPIIPGTSIKGVLRSRCEYILRSLGVDACEDGSCGRCAPCELFGFSLNQPDAEGRVGRRGRVAIADGVFRAPELQWRNHVAIDRVTGGARDQALFTDEVVVTGRVTIRVEPLNDEVPNWARGLVLAALADIDDGFVGVGGGTTRGQGSLRSRSGRIAELHAGEISEALDSLRSTVGQEDSHV